MPVTFPGLQLSNETHFWSHRTGEEFQEQIAWFCLVREGDWYVVCEYLLTRWAWINFLHLSVLLSQCLTTRTERLSADESTDQVAGCRFQESLFLDMNSRKCLENLVIFQSLSFTYDEHNSIYSKSEAFTTARKFPEHLGVIVEHNRLFFSYVFLHGLTLTFTWGPAGKVAENVRSNILQTLLYHIYSCPIWKVKENVSTCFGYKLR